MNIHTDKIEVGAVKIHKNVISSIASIAALEIEGVKQIAKAPGIDFFAFLGFKSSGMIRVEFGKNDEMRLKVPLIVKYGYSIPEIAENVQDNVRQALEKMLDKSPRDIHISIQGIEK